MPLSGPSAAALNAALTDSAVADFDSIAVRSTTETFGVGTRNAIPSSLPLSCGSTSPTAAAAPVVVGMIESAAARAPQVLVRQVEQVLVVRVGVDGRHPALHDAERLVEDFRDWRETVRGARRIRNDLVLRRIV